MKVETFISVFLILSTTVVAEYLDNHSQLTGVVQQVGLTPTVKAMKHTATLMYLLYWVFAVALLVASAFIMDWKLIAGYVAVALMMPVARLLANLLSNAYMKTQVAKIQQEVNQSVKNEVFGTHSYEDYTKKVNK